MANGLFGGGDGTELNPYLIEDALDLNAIRNNLTAHYKLVSDIDLNISPFNTDEGWVPIGDYSTNTTLLFNGVFDGNNHIVSNLYIYSSKTYRGLFGRIDNATIKNLELKDINVQGGQYTSGIVGYSNNNSVVDSCYSMGNITITIYNYIGGIAGYSNSSTIKNCCFSGSLNGKDYIGGITGYNKISTIKNCCFSGSINGTGQRIGGMTGYNYAQSNVINCYSTGSITGTTSVGGLVGEQSSSTVINSFWDIDTSGQTVSAGGIGLTTTEMKTSQTYINVGWDLETLTDGKKIWILIDGEYPKLYYQIFKKFLLQLEDNRIFTIQDNILVETTLTLSDIATTNIECKNNFDTLGFSQINELLQGVVGSRPIDSLNIGSKVIAFTDVSNIPKVVEGVDVHNTKLYQLSKDGVNFVGYDGSNWTTEYKMNETELESLTTSEYLQFHTQAYKERLFLKTYLDSNNEVNPIMLKKVTLTYSPNTAPSIKEAKLSLSEIHNEDTTLSAKLIDNEGDSIQYRILLRKPSEFTFSQITPETGWISKSSTNDTITHIYNKSNFEAGTNKLKIETKDSRGLTSSSSELSLVFSNEKPIQTSLVYSDFDFQAIVTDNDDDKIAYRVFINGQQKFPSSGYTSFEAPPREITYSWNSSDLVFGVDNQIKLEVIDEVGGKLEISFNVVGKYKGLLFKDELGNYYTTDSGQILKYLDFGSFIAGTITTPKKVILQNNSGNNVANVTIKGSDTTLYSNVLLQVSTSLSPFNESGQIVIPYTLEHGDEAEFYIRLKTDRQASYAGEITMRLDVE